jgi:hydrogenase-1 operon protein HyaF
MEHVSLEHITVKVETADAHSIGSLHALVAEIAARVQKLLADGETAMIDLHSLPFAPGEYEQLRQALGAGEISARLELIGTSEIVETHFPGVWWVTHYNVEGDIIADLIEITFVPDILRSQPEDVQEGLARLQEMLSHTTPHDD